MFAVVVESLGIVVFPQFSFIPRTMCRTKILLVGAPRGSKSILFALGANLWKYSSTNLLSC